MARHTYLAQWVWNTAEGWWEAPLRAQCTGSIDLRSNAQCGTAVTPLGYGLFTYPAQVTIAGSLYFGVDNFRISLAKRSTLNSMLGVTVVNRDTDLIIKELLVDLADPTGQTRWRPIRVGADKRLKFGMSGVVLADETVGDLHPAFENTLAVRHADYRRAKIAGEPLTNLRKWTGYDLRKYGVSLDRLLDAQDRADGSEAPATVISDNFNRANESLDVGPWNEVVADWSVTGNQAVIAAATGFTATAEGTITTTRLFDAQLIAPTNQYIYQFPLGQEPVLVIGNSCRIRVHAPAAVNAIAWLEITI